jgi:hypothetical protein
MLVDAANPPQRARLATIRRTDLPSVEDAGTLRPLGLPAGSGLAEGIHLVFFPQQIIGADFNFYGPRATSFARFHNMKTKDVENLPEIEIEPLLRADVAASVRALTDLKVLRLKVRRPFIETVRRADQTLGRAFRAAAEASGAEQVDIVLSPPPHSRKEVLKSDLLPAVRRLVRSAERSRDVRAFEVKGDSPDGVEYIDVLRSQLLTRKRVVKLNPESRALDSESAYEAIQEAHNELSGEIRDAAAVSLA